MAEQQIHLEEMALLKLNRISEAQIELGEGAGVRKATLFNSNTRINKDRWMRTLNRLSKKGLILVEDAPKTEIIDGELRIKRGRPGTIITPI